MTGRRPSQSSSEVPFAFDRSQLQSSNTRRPQPPGSRNSHSTSVLEHGEEINEILRPLETNMNISRANVVSATQNGTNRVPSISPSMSYVNVLSYFLSCLASVCFLVFMSASVPFVITNVIGKKGPIGDDVGNLGFADQIVSIIMAPLWGALSDKAGTRIVTSAGYIILGAALILFVNASSVYPNLLVYRMIVAVSGSACIAMVTAMLPQLTNYSSKPQTQLRGERNFRGQNNGKISGMAGFCTGIGALIAVLVLLPLPHWLIDRDMSLTMAQAVKRSFYLVGGVAISTGIILFAGLKKEKNKSLRRLIKNRHLNRIYGCLSNEELDELLVTQDRRSYVRLVGDGIGAARDGRIALAYIGGFVARAASVVVSSFIPTLVASYYVSNGQCNIDPNVPAGDLKKNCREAYIIASSLTGTTQLCALIFAPIFGYLSDKFDKRLLLSFAVAAGIIGFAGFGKLNQEPSNTNYYIFASLMGVSQIGSIVTSLSLTTGPYVQKSIRGSVAGAYSLAGGCGVLLISKVGGNLFDKSGPGVPFILMAVLQGIAFSISLFSYAADQIWKRYTLEMEAEEMDIEDQEWEIRQRLIERIDG